MSRGLIDKFVDKVITWVSGFGIASKTTVNASTLANATSTNPWTAPADGILVFSAGTTAGQRAYWYFNDLTDNIGLVRATRLETANYQLSGTCPVIKGHKYYSQKVNISPEYANLYIFGGGGTA